jgi:hypothetical protein
MPAVCLWRSRRVCVPWVYGIWYSHRHYRWYARKFDSTSTFPACRWRHEGELHRPCNNFRCGMRFPDTLSTCHKLNISHNAMEGVKKAEECRNTSIQDCGLFWQVFASLSAVYWWYSQNLTECSLPTGANSAATSQAYTVISICDLELLAQAWVIISECCGLSGIQLLKTQAKRWRFKRGLSLGSHWLLTSWRRAISRNVEVLHFSSSWILPNPQLSYVN